MYRLIIALLICTFFSCKSAEQKDQDHLWMENPKE